MLADAAELASCSTLRAERWMRVCIPGSPQQPAMLRLAMAGPLSRGAHPRLRRRRRPAAGELSRRSFMRRMVGSARRCSRSSSCGGTLAFLWPNITRGHRRRRSGSGRWPTSSPGRPRSPRAGRLPTRPGRIFLINVPAAEALALGTPKPVANPGAGQLLALWRKCPHLGCQVPDLCDSVKRFHCRCHGSVYNILGEKLKNGPAQRGMDRFPVTIGDDGVIVIDTSQRIAGPPVRGEDALTFHDAFPYAYTCDDA